MSNQSKLTLMKSPMMRSAFLPSLMRHFSLIDEEMDEDFESMGASNISLSEDDKHVWPVPLHRLGSDDRDARSGHGASNQSRVSVHEATDVLGAEARHADRRDASTSVRRGGVAPRRLRPPRPQGAQHRVRAPRGGMLWDRAALGGGSAV